MDLLALTPWQNGLIFATAAAVVWFAGVRLAGLVDAIADRTGIGKAFLGLVMLAGATELPELATTTAAALAGDAQLAVNNMFGGVVMQTAVLAVADVALVPGALTWFAPRAVLLLEGNLLLLLLALTAAGLVVGEPVTIGWIGVWPLLLFAGYLVALRMLRRHEGDSRWQPVDPPRPPEKHDGVGVRERYAGRALSWLSLAFAASSLAILVAGAFLAWSGEALAEQTGLGSSFVGASLLAASTSLPELSTTLAAVRIGSYAMAVSNIFGSNMIMVALLLPADLATRDGPILAAVDDSARFVVAAGMAVTGLYLVGMIERRNRTVLRMGYDSAGVLALYVLSLCGVYLLR